MKKLYGAFLTCLYLVFAAVGFDVSPMLFWVVFPFAFLLGCFNIGFALLGVKSNDVGELRRISRASLVLRFLTCPWVYIMFAVGFGSILYGFLIIFIPFLLIFTPILGVTGILLICAAYSANFVGSVYSIKIIWLGYKQGAYSLLKTAVLAALQLCPAADIIAAVYAHSKIKNVGRAPKIADPSDN